jgi:hypothetical protein
MFRFFLLAIFLAVPAMAQEAAGQHEGMQHGLHSPGMHHPDDAAKATIAPGRVSEGGQSAFAAIQEIVAILMADPQTDWSRVDIDALRRHLVDMDNVTLRALVEKQKTEGGARFEATSDDPAVTASIRAMVPAHVAAMNGVEGWSMQAEEIPGGAALTVTGADPERIYALGFLGIMTVGMHHQEHHLALASGRNPHAH